jgi:hypothetical protein
MNMENRIDYRSERGVASWWAKDGAWHVALPEPGRDGFFWTAQQFKSREDAINAISEHVVR